MSSVITTLTSSQFQTVYNVFSFALAAMLFTSLFLLVSQSRVLPRYRQAIVVSAVVCGIAAYHYVRIFNSFNDAYVATSVGGAHVLTPLGFNEAYRYVDWLLTVPLLLLETVAVLALPRDTRKSLLTKLIPASVLMIALGYPGEIAVDTAPKMIWGALSTIPFIYILYVLFVELTKSLDRQPPEVAASVGRLRLLLIATWPRGDDPTHGVVVYTAADDADVTDANAMRAGPTDWVVGQKTTTGFKILETGDFRHAADGSWGLP